MFKVFLKTIISKSIHFLQVSSCGSFCLGVLCSKPWIVKWWSLLWAQLLWRGCYGGDRAGMLGGGREARILPILVTMRGYTRNYHHQSRPLRPPPDTEYPSAPSRSHKYWSTLNLGRYYGTNCWGATDGHMQWDLDPTQPIKTFFIVIFSKHLRCGEQYHVPENISIPLLCEQWALWAAELQTKVPEAYAKFYNHEEGPY